MDVTCERCGTEYEFEETLVSERGTTVKCTQCGHLFKVFRPGGEIARPWILRQADGRQETLDSLADLQKRITRGEVTPGDRISRSGDDWKPLGEIAELEPFFQAARTAAETARRAPSNLPPRRASRPAPGRPTTSSRPPEPRAPKRTLMGMGLTSPSAPPTPAAATQRTPPPAAAPPAPAGATEGTPAPPRSEPPPRLTPPPSAPPRPPKRPADPNATAAGRGQFALDATLPAGQASPMATSDATVPDSSPPPAKSDARNTPTLEAPAPSPAGVGAATRDERSRSERRDSERPTAGGAGRRHVLYLDDEEIKPPKKSSGGRVFPWVVLILLVAGGAAVAMQWERVAPLIGLGPEPAGDGLAEGDDAFARATREGYAEAVTAYESVAESPEQLVRLGRAHAAWAQALHFRASDLDARALADPSLAAEAAPLHEESREHARAAADHARKSLRSRPRDASAELVMADALRLLGDEGWEEHLERAEEGLPEPTVDLRITQALARAESTGLAEALPHARRAAQVEPTPIRALLLLARVALAADDIGEARTALRRIRETDPDHPEARYLGEAIDRGIPPAAPVVATPDGGTPDAGAATATEEPMDTEAPAETAAEPETESQSAGRRGDRPPAGRDYSWYIRRGDELRRGGSYAEAREHYQQALELRPGSTEATTGLGYVELMSGHPEASLSFFRSGVRADYGDAYMGLGDAYRRMGRTTEARRVYETYLRSQPRGVHASRARRLLEELPGGEPESSMESSPSDSTMATAPEEEAPAPADPTPAAATEEAPTGEGDNGE